MIDCLCTGLDMLLATNCHENTDSYSTTDEGQQQEKKNNAVIVLRVFGLRCDA